MVVWPSPLSGALLTLLAVLAVLSVQPTRCLPVSSTALAELGQQPQERLTEAAVYLKTFGWLDPSYNPTNGKIESLVALSDKLAEFQSFAGLTVTGVMDEATLSKMREPRCGVPDRGAPIQPQGRMAQYVLQGSNWPEKDLTYRIRNWPNINNRTEVRKSMVGGFKAWSDVSTLTFQEVQSSADIDIRFEAGRHGDGNPFDGRGGTLAHAFFPRYGGDVHFDKSEPWSVGPFKNRGIDLLTVAAHEFGHSLGIAHSRVRNALMAPFYIPPDQDGSVVKLDDIYAIQELYGAPPSILCTDSSVDAMLTTTSNGKSRTYAFKGDNYWRLTNQGVEIGYPLKIRDRWGGVPDNLDAVLAYTPSSSPPAKELLFFFKGQQVWRMTNVPNLDTGYPKAISDEFEGIPGDIDAAITWARNNKIYFFKGTQFWKFDYELAQDDQQAVSDRYPGDISVWKGVPNDIDTAMTWTDRKTYFFKGTNYYMFNNERVRVSSGYPRNTGVSWFGCSRRTSSLLPPESRQQGDIAAEDSYGDAVVGFGDGDIRPLRQCSGAAGLLSSVLSSLLLLLLLPVMLAALCS